MPDVLDELHRRGLSIAVCSNWGWDLEPFLYATGVVERLDAHVTSARVGFRKANPSIYGVVLDLLGIKAEDAVFVGDTWSADVLGPITCGMRAIHVVRDGAATPALIDAAARISSLRDLVDKGLAESF